MDLTNVSSRHDLAEFLGELRLNLQEDRDTWHNVSLNDYLEAVTGWLQDAPDDQIPELPAEAWRAAALFFHVGRIYE